MVYPKKVTIQSKSISYGRIQYCALDIETKIINLGDTVQLDLNLNNIDLKPHKFSISPGSIIIHDNENSKCIESYPMERTHHIVVFAIRPS